MEEPRLSIIIPFYNDDEWIGRMLDSLLDQDLPKDQYEIIIVDDGSTGPTTTLKQYVDNYPNIRLFHQANGGLSAARNSGIDLAKGEWLYLCDSDDFIQPNILGSLLDIAEEKDLDGLICDWRIVGMDTVPEAVDSPIQVSEVYT